MIYKYAILLHPYVGLRISNAANIEKYIQTLHKSPNGFE